MRNHRQRMRMQKLRVLDKEVPEDISFDQANFRVAKRTVVNVNGLMSQTVYVSHQGTGRDKRKIMIFKVLIRKREYAQAAEDQSDFSCVTAVKNGTALITVTIDGISKTCEITVKKPVIQFEKESVTLQVKETYQTKVTVSSKNKPVYSSSNTTIASVNENGVIHAKAVGKAYIYAKEDGTKERMTVIVK